MWSTIGALFFRCLYACEPSSRSLREDPPSNRPNTRSTPHTASKAPKGREGIRTWNKAKSRRGIANGRSQGARIARTLQAGLSRSAAQRWHQERALARSADLCRWAEPFSPVQPCVPSSALEKEPRTLLMGRTRVHADPCPGAWQVGWWPRPAERLVGLRLD